MSDAATQDNPVTVQTGTRIQGSDLLNLLNYVNFREGTVFVHFRHRRKGDSLSFAAFPLPSQGEVLECRWLAPGVPAEVIVDYSVVDFLVSDGRTLVVVEPELLDLNRDHVVFRLPEQGVEKGSRRVRRHRVTGVAVTILQASFRFAAALEDFNAVSFRVALADDRCFGLNPAEPVHVLFEREGRLLYTGEARLSRTDGASGFSAVLTPGTDNLRRYAPKQIRSDRRVFVPAPRVTFEHPLTGTRHTLTAVNLSGGGLAVDEFFDEAVLLPGLILPGVRLELGNRVLATTEVQVLHRQMTDTQGARPAVRCGLAFLDLSLDDQAGLASLIHEALNSHLRVCSPVQMDELWRFFFESGFLYASKYAALEGRRQEFQRVYQKLYLESPSIARHFLYEDKSRLLAHMSMLRAHPRSWLIHHHAATRSGYALAGVAVLDQIGRYINDFHHHPSTKMDYVMCYFRRENKFPNRVFGGSAGDVADPKGISLDDFAYLPLEARPEAPPVTYQILPVSDDDRAELAGFYAARSGGLLLDALNLGTSPENDDEINRTFRDLGFVRDHLVLSWKAEGVLKAVVAVHSSDVGLNLSNLTNCLHAFVVEGSGLTPDQLLAGLWDLRHSLGLGELPVLVYPPAFLEDGGRPVEKKYTAWVLNMTHLDGYFQSVDKRFRRRGHGPS